MSDRARKLLIFCAASLACVIVTISLVLVLLGRRTDDNCERIHKVVVAVDSIIADSAARIVKLGQEGTLTPEQVQRGLQDVREQRKKLAPADCPERTDLPDIRP